MEVDYGLFATIKQNFDQHLSQEGNERVLYSGKFGVGKSTFLRHYFENNDKYNCIHLYPVNYSILSNEDIFTYLKFDIFFDLLIEKKVVLDESTKYGLDVALPYFLQNNWYRFLSLVPHMFDKVGGVVPGKGISEVLKALGELYKEYEVFANPKDGDIDKFNAFQMEMINKEGGLYESNALTNIIKTELDELKTTSGKENILIIDDLDRLDPDHIFRLLNVFSAHFDTRNKIDGETSSNKYGFDKIILVCDNENIRNIFKARYGVDTDYNGYIDKFYSLDIFEHRIGDLIDIFSKSVFERLTTGHLSKLKDDHSSYLSPYLSKIVGFLLTQNLINLRTLFKHSSSEINISNLNTMYSSMERITKHSFFTIVILDVLTLLYGDKTNLKVILSKINYNLSNESLNDDLQLKAIIYAELIYLNRDTHTRWERDEGNHSKSIVTYIAEEFEIFRSFFSDRSHLFSMDEVKASSLDLNFIELFKKYGLEKYI